MRLEFGELVFTQLPSNLIVGWNICLSVNNIEMVPVLQSLTLLNNRIVAKIHLSFASSWHLQIPFKAPDSAAHSDY